MSDSMPPKLFISYSWSNPDHQNWVVELATELRESGVDVILDKWDLREGHDAFAFMEQMVTDPAIKKVILICDQKYVAKANGREGGAGTEAQIITSEIYKSQSQSKFVAIIRERDSEGKALVPAYYASRIHIDMSDPTTYAASYEQLVRWVFDKPFYEKPPLGQKPAYLSDSQSDVHLATGAAYRRAMDAIKTGKEHAVPALSEYLAIFDSEMEKFRITKSELIFDDAFIDSINAFIPYRNEMLSLYIACATYRYDEEILRTFHRFFEKIIRYSKLPHNVNQWIETDFDNFKFVIHELYLYLLACLVKFERFDAVDTFIQMEFFVTDPREGSREPMQTFSILRWHLKALENRNHRLQLRRLSLRADLLKERCHDLGVEFDKLMAADFILFFRSCMVSDYFSRWWPETLLYVGHFGRSFEMFARSKSKKYFSHSKVTLGVVSKEELGGLLDKIEQDPSGIPRWEHNSFSPRVLLGFDQIATTP